MDWPDLSKIKYVSGRAATEQDINEGSAVFILQTEGVNIGTPINILLPQYAYHRDVDTGEINNVIVIQAESARGNDIYGAIIVETGGFLAGTSLEFQLLGQALPK